MVHRCTSGDKVIRQALAVSDISVNAVTFLRALSYGNSRQTRYNARGAAWGGLGG